MHYISVETSKYQAYNLAMLLSMQGLEQSRQDLYGKCPSTISRSSSTICVNFKPSSSRLEVGNTYVSLLIKTF
jgi:hypothetical protein